MKKTLTILVLLLSCDVFAMGFIRNNFFPSCKDHDVSVENQELTLEFLKSVEGYYELEKCKVHIDVLDESDSTGLLKAEILIQNSVNEEFYIPVFFIDQRRTKKMNFCLKSSDNRIHYEFKDRNRTGNRNYKRHYILNVQVDPESEALTYLEAGVRDGQSRKKRWVNCSVDTQEEL
ncbi:MAG: hypothetical protein CL677_09285 [Bdellovibrionaceae bacterium]|nr:hypothetical protein [Pseudobdellovibrionaceae bacterium]